MFFPFHRSWASRKRPSLSHPSYLILNPLWSGFPPHHSFSFPQGRLQHLLSEYMNNFQILCWHIRTDQFFSWNSFLPLALVVACLHNLLLLLNPLAPSCPFVYWCSFRVYHHSYYVLKSCLGYLIHFHVFSDNLYVKWLSNLYLYPDLFPYSRLINLTIHCFASWHFIYSTNMSNLHIYTF